MTEILFPSFFYHTSCYKLKYTQLGEHTKFKPEEIEWVLYFTRNKEVCFKLKEYIDFFKYQLVRRVLSLHRTHQPHYG